MASPSRSFADLGAGTLSAGGRTPAPARPRSSASTPATPSATPRSRSVGAHIPGRGAGHQRGGGASLGVGIGDTVSVRLPGRTPTTSWSRRRHRRPDPGPVAVLEPAGRRPRDVRLHPQLGGGRPGHLRRRRLTGLRARRHTAASGSRDPPIREVDIGVDRDLLDADPGDRAGPDRTHRRRSHRSRRAAGLPARQHLQHPGRRRRTTPTSPSGSSCSSGSPGDPCRDARRVRRHRARRERSAESRRRCGSAARAADTCCDARAAGSPSPPPGPSSASRSGTCRPPSARARHAHPGATHEPRVSGVLGIVGGLRRNRHGAVRHRTPIDRPRDQRGSAPGNASTPVWRRDRLDLIGVVVVAVATGGRHRAVGAFEGTPGSVYLGRSVELPWLLVLPDRGLDRRQPPRPRADRPRLLADGRTAAVNLRSARCRACTGSASRRRPWAVGRGRRRRRPDRRAGDLPGGLHRLLRRRQGRRRPIRQRLRHPDHAQRRQRPRPYVRRPSHGVPGRRHRRRHPRRLRRSNVILRSDRTSDPANLAAVDPDAYARGGPRARTTNSPRTAARGASGLKPRDPPAILVSEDMAALPPGRSRRHPPRPPRPRDRRPGRDRARARRAVRAAARVPRRRRRPDEHRHHEARPPCHRHPRLLPRPRPTHRRRNRPEPGRHRAYAAGADDASRSTRGPRHSPRTSPASPR